METKLKQHLLAKTAATTIIGLTIEQAEQYCFGLSLDNRLVNVNGSPLMKTNDVKSSRLNLTVIGATVQKLDKYSVRYTGGIVIKATLG